MLIKKGNTMAKKKQKKNQTQGYLDIIKKDVLKMSKMAKKPRKLKIKRQHITIKSGSAITALDGNCKERDFILNEDICVWMETDDTVEVYTEKNHACKCGGKCKAKAEKVETITIEVKGGSIQEIDNPTKHRIIVRDYDVGGFESDQLSTDENGDECAESEW